MTGEGLVVRGLSSPGSFSLSKPLREQCPLARLKFRGNVRIDPIGLLSETDKYDYRETQKEK